MFNMAKFVFEISLLVFLTFGSDVCSQEDASKSSTSSYYYHLTKLSSWYADVAPQQNHDQIIKFVKTFDGIRRVIDNLIHEKNNVLDNAFAHSCYLGLLGTRKRLDFIANIHFPTCLRDLQLNERYTWKAFFFLQPETAGQKRFQDRLRKTGISPRGIAGIIAQIYANVAEVAHPSYYLKFFDSQSFIEKLPKCFSLFNLEGEETVGIGSLQIILERESLNSTDKKPVFVPKHWTTARIIRIIGLDEMVAISEIRTCFKRDNIHYDFKYHYLTAENEASIYIIEYFSSELRTNEEIMETLKSCNLGNLNSLMDTQDKFIILSRFESENPNEENLNGRQSKQKY